MDLIHPREKGEVVEALASASSEGRRILTVGGRHHIDRGNPTEIDAELWTTQLDAIVSYEPAEMIAVVEAGIRVGALRRALASHDQEWPVDASDDATVGGVIAAAPASLRSLKLGHIRDSVVELELVTGDGRLIRSGARTVKNVTGYDIHRLATGSLGTLGVIVQVALKVRPRAKSRRTLVFAKDGGLRLGTLLLDAIPQPAGVLASPGRVEVRLEGWPNEVEEQTAAARTVTSDLFVLEEGPFPAEPIDDAPVVVEASVTPSKMGRITEGREDWSALLGVGIVWFRLDDSPEALGEVRARVSEAGGVAPVAKGRGGLGDAPAAAIEVHRRLKHAFDPANILAPGRFWGSL